MASVLRLRLWLVALLAVSLVAGCGDDGDDPASDAASTPAEVSDPSAEATAPTVEEIPAPAVAEARDVLFLGDGNEIFRYTVADLYQQRAEEELGVDVRITEVSRTPFYPDVERVLDLFGDEEFAEKVRNAEIIVVQTWPSGTIDLRIYFSTCWDQTPIPETPDPAVYDTVEYWAKYQEVLGEVYAEISELRHGEPTVVIGVDIYNASVAAQQEAGITAECRAFFERWSAAQREVAETHGAVWVSLYDTLNGPNHDVDPLEQGYLGSTEEMRGLSIYAVNEIGSAMIADALAAVGFEPEP